jgi:hypothetical protein
MISNAHLFVSTAGMVNLNIKATPGEDLNIAGQTESMVTEGRATFTQLLVSGLPSDKPYTITFALTGAAEEAWPVPVNMSVYIRKCVQGALTGCACMRACLSRPRCQQRHSLIFHPLVIGID